MSKAAMVITAILLTMLGVVGTAAADPTPTPPVSSGLQLWYEAGSLATANGQPVASWPDKSGNGRTLTSFDAGSAGTMRANAINGRAAVELDGSHSLLKTYGSTFSLSTPTTFFIVYRSLDPDTAGARNFVFDSRDSSQREVLGRPSTGSIRMYANIDMDFAGITYPNPSYGIWSGTFNGSSSSLFKDGTLVGSGNAGSGALTGFTLGALSTSAQYGYDYSHSLVAEVLYYSGALSAADQQATVNWLNEKYATFGGAPTPPNNTGAPTISGSATTGSTLTASNGTWTGTTPITFTHQWQRCNTFGFCNAISGATASTYVPVAADVGSRLRVVVTGTNSAGSDTGTSATTATVTSATPTPPSNTTPPAVSGNAWVGQTLTTTDGTWSGSQPQTYAYAWQRCDTSGASCGTISGATASTYTPTATDVGSTLRSRVTATNSAGSASASSSATDVVVANTAPPVSSGLQLWYEANTASYGDGQSVTRWPDQSGNHRDLTAFDSGAAATMRKNALNGRAAIEFDGSNSLLKTYESTFTLAQPDTYFIVYRQFDQREAYIWDSRNASVRQLLGQGPFSDMEMYANVDLIDSNLTWPFPSYEIWAGTFQGDNSTLYRNGSLVASGRTGSSALEGFTVGGLSTSNQYGYLRSHSLVAEILYYTGALSDTQRDSVTNWLNQKYGILSPPTAPANTTRPAISGSTVVAHKLSATNGTWSGSQPQSYAYEWRRCDTGGGSCTAISGATASTYTTTAGDVGSTIKVAVTASNSAGQATAASDPTAVITAAAGGDAPPVTAGLELWFNANAENYAEGEHVTTWPDHSGNGRDLTAFDAGAAPTYRANAVAGRAAVEFDGSSSLLKTYGSTFTLPQPTTFFIAYKQLDTGAGDFVFDSRDGSARQLFGQNTAGKLDAYANNPLSADATIPFSGYQVWSGTFNGSSSTLWQNGTQVAAGNAGGSGLAGLTVGALSTSGQYGYAYSHSLVAEILYYTGSLSDDDRAAVTNWLKARYAL
jgi:hypothetical protein